MSMFFLVVLSLLALHRFYVKGDLVQLFSKGDTTRWLSAQMVNL